MAGPGSDWRKTCVWALPGVVFEGLCVVIRPATKHVLELLGGAVAVVALGAGMLAFKLANGPVSLKFMAPTFASILKQQMGGAYRFEIADVELSWSKSAHALGVALQNVDLYDRSGLLVAGVPKLDVGISTEGLQHGIFAPTRVNLEKASILVERTASGTFSIGAPQTGAGKGDASVLPLLLDNLFGKAGKPNVATYLTDVVVQDADFTLIDRRTGITIHAPDARLNLQRTDHGFKGRMEATADVGDQHAHVVLAGGFDLKTQSGTVDASFSPVRFSHFASLSSFYAALAPLDMPIGGVAHLDLGAKGLITRADLALDGLGGQLLAHGDPKNTLDIQSAAFKGTYWPQTGEIAIDALNFSAGTDHGEISGHARLTTVQGTPLRVLGASVALHATNIGFSWPGIYSEPVTADTAELVGDVTFGDAWSANIKTAKIAFGAARIELAGDVAAAPGSPAAHLNGQITDFPAGDIARYWPESTAVHARNWVVRHVHGGKLTKGILTVDAPGGAFAAAQIDDKILKLDFHIDGGESAYFGSLPPLTQIAADGTLTPGTFSLKIDHAKLLDSTVSGGHVSIPQLGVKGSTITIEADAQGRIEQILDVLDRDPLRLIAKYGLKSGDISGDASVHVTFGIPQQSDNPDDKVAFSVDAKGEHVALQRIVPHVTLDGGTLSLKVDNDSLEGTGQIALNGSPAQFAWHEHFKDPSGMPTEFKVHTVLDEEARAGLGLDTGSSVTGPVGIDVTARGKGAALRMLSAQLDLTKSALDLATVGWSKAVGTPAKVDAELAFGADGAITAKDLRAQGQGIDISGSAKLAADGKLLSASFPHLRLDGLVDVALNTDRNPTDGGLQVKVQGRFLKLGPFIKQMTDSGDQKNTMPWRLDASLERATLRNDVTVSDLRATITSTGPRLKSIEARGAFVAGGNDFTATLSETGSTTRRVLIETSDAGHLIEGITGFKSIAGGNFSLNAKLSDDVTASNGRLPVVPVADTKGHGGMEGTLRIDDFKVVDAPLLARLLTIGSLKGMGDLATGQGIEFKRLQAPFWMEDGSIGIEDARASGPAIGVTLQGVIDRKKSATDLNGTIVPAYSINSALGSLPVVGPLFVSRKGEGIFGFTYNVTGELKDPRVMVNPLSALAPGFLRRLFEIGEAQAGDSRPSTRAPDAPVAQ